MPSQILLFLSRLPIRYYLSSRRNKADCAKAHASTETCRDADRHKPATKWPSTLPWFALLWFLFKRRRSPCGMQNRTCTPTAVVYARVFFVRVKAKRGTGRGKVSHVHFPPFFPLVSNWKKLTTDTQNTHRHTHTHTHTHTQTNKHNTHARDQPHVHHEKIRTHISQRKLAFITRIKQMSATNTSATPNLSLARFTSHSRTRVHARVQALDAYMKPDTHTPHTHTHHAHAKGTQTSVSTLVTMPAGPQASTTALRSSSFFLTIWVFYFWFLICDFLRND